MSDKDSDERLDRIEMKMAYLEDFLQRLQTEVVSRNIASDKLINEQKAVREKLQQIMSELEEIPNRKPPHY